MSINYDYYRVFYYTAKYQNITLAANALLYNQPNVTRTIKNLEAELGCTLFVRSNRGVTLTPEGERLYEHVKIAVEQIETAEAELESAKSLLSGTVSIGATEVALRCFLLPALNAFRRKYPGIRLNITNYSTVQAISSLKSNLVDIAVVTTPTDDLRGLSSVPLISIQEIAVCGDFFSELVGRPLSIQDLTHYPIISLGRKTMTYELYRQWFAEDNIGFSPVIEAATADQILPIVKNNLGIGFVPEAFLQDETSSLIHRLTISKALPERNIVLLKQRNGALNTAAKKLFETIAGKTNETQADAV